MEERYMTEGPMDADTLRTMGVSLIKPSTRLNLLALGGGLVILAIILLTQGDKEKFLLCVLALALYGLGLTVYAKQCEKRAIDDMKQQTGGAGWTERVSFETDGIHQWVSGQETVTHYSQLTQADRRGGLLVLFAKDGRRLTVFFSQLNESEQQALCAMLWKKCPELDMPRRLRPKTKKGEKRSGGNDTEKHDAA